MADDPDAGAPAEARSELLHRTRRVSQLAALGLLVVGVIGGEHLIRGDHVFPLWIFLVLGGSFVWVLVSFELMHRKISRKARRKGDAG